MHYHTTLTLALLVLGLPLVNAMPQTQTDRAYPQEIYPAAGYRMYNPQTLFDLLQRLPGVTLGMQADGLEEIQLHGIDSRYVKLLLNGQPLSGSGLNGSMLTRQIPASLIDRIEIDRSGRSDLYTGGGGGGTINVILANAYSDSGLQLSLGGPHLSNRQSAAAGWMDDEGTQATHLSAERRLERRHWQGQARDASGHDDFQHNFREQQTSLLLNYAGLLGNRHPLQLYALHIDADEEDQRSGLYPLNALQVSAQPAGSLIDQQQQLQRRNQRLGGDLQLNWQQWHLQLFFLYERFRQQQQLYLQQEATNQQQQLSDQRFYAGWQLQQTQYEHQWSTGLSLEYRQRDASASNNRVISSNNERTLLPLNYEYDEYLLSYHLLDRWHLSANTRLEAGFHFDAYEMQHRNQGDSLRSEVFSDTHWLPSFHWLHELSGRNRLRLSISQSTRQPEVADRIPYRLQQDNRVWLGNADLQAEVISNFDLSYEHNPRLRGSSYNDYRSGYQLRLFRRVISHAIVPIAWQESTASGTQTLLQPVNSENSATVHGAEVESGLQLLRHGIELDFGLAWYHSALETDPQRSGRERLPGQPGYLLRLGLSSRHGHWQSGFLWRLQGDTEQYLHNADGSYQLQTRSGLQQLDLFTRRHWQHWQAGLNLSLNPSPAVRWQQGDRLQQLQERWYLRLNLSTGF